MIGHNIPTSKSTQILLYKKIFKPHIFLKSCFPCICHTFLSKVFYDVACSPLHYLQVFMRYIWQIQCCEEVIHSLGPPRESIIHVATKNYFYILIKGVLGLSNQNIEHLFNILLTIKFSKSFINSRGTCSKLGIHCKIPLTPSIVLCRSICAAIRNPVDGTTMAT